MEEEDRGREGGRDMVQVLDCSLVESSDEEDHESGQQEQQHEGEEVDRVDDCNEERYDVKHEQHQHYDDHDQDQDRPVERHLDFGDEQGDVESHPTMGRDEEMSRKFDVTPSKRVERTNSNDSLEDIATSHKKKKSNNRNKSNAEPEGIVSMVLSDSKDWLGEVWRDLTCANASKCLSIGKLSMETLFNASDTWSKCYHYLLAGLVVSLICEIVVSGPQYNTALLLSLIAAAEFQFFPSNSVRPHLVFAVLVAISYFMDILLFVQPQRKVKHTAKALTAIVFLAKGLAMYNFLFYSNSGARAKKYLWRRIRVFFIPLSYPRKPMREIRSRVLAIEWLQGGVAVGYLVLFVYAYMTIGSSDVMSSPAAGMALMAFLPIKFLTSTAILLVLIIDTDVTLCLAYFGCLGGMMSYVKAYIHSKYLEYGGWPLSYALNPYRVYAIAVVKFVDVCLGFAGWAALGTTSSEYNSLGYNVMAVVSGTITILVLSDIWVPILFYFVIRMIRRHDKLVRRLQENEEDSDDSELDEFDIRNNEKAIKNGRAMMYRSLNRGFLKPFKSSNSVGSSSSYGEGDLSSSDSSDEESNKKRRKRKESKHNRDDESQTRELHGGGGGKEASSMSHGINLEMALGENDSAIDSDNEEREEHFTDRGKSQRLTSPGGYNPASSRLVSPIKSRITSPGAYKPSNDSLVSPNVISAAPGWERQDRSYSSFSPGKGNWDEATSNARALNNGTRPKVSFDDAVEQHITSNSDHNFSPEKRQAKPLPPKSAYSMKLPPLDTTKISTFSSPKVQGRPPSVPKLQLTAMSSPTATPVKNFDDIDSDFEYTFDSPYQPQIRTKTGTPIQKFEKKPLPPVSQPPSLVQTQINPVSDITVEDGSSISPDRFTEMWDGMDVTSSFTAQLHQEDVTINQKLMQLVTHLQSEKFHVVAAGESEGVITVYGFASGFKKTDDNDLKSMDDSLKLGVTSVCFLMELRVNTDSGSNPPGLWSFECNCKCTHTQASAVFIKMMLLGDCLQLVKNPQSD